jgi:hypothetical protein
MAMVFHTSTVLDSRLRQPSLVHDLLVVAGAKLNTVGEEYPARQAVARLAAIELELDPPV